jgi:transcription elongation factor Elf1
MKTIIAPLFLYTCPFCHRQTFTPSSIFLHANYESKHDGESVTVKICGQCMDSIIDHIIKSVSDGLDESIPGIVIHD